MQLGVPWKVKGIRPDARETAREAARRAGMSVGEWLNSVIVDSAFEEGVRLRRRYEPDDDDAEEDNLSGVHQRLDELARQLEHMSVVAKFAPPQSRPEPSESENSRQVAEAIARLDRRLDDLINSRTIFNDPPPQYAPPRFMEPPQPPRFAEPPQPSRFAEPERPVPVRPAKQQPVPVVSSELDEAMAEIIARQQALDADPAASRPSAPPPKAANPPPIEPQIPAQNLSGLEQQLRHITTQIEALRRPAELEEGILALRRDLGAIARTLTEAMPRRAIEAIETEVRALASRLDSTRHSGVNGDTLGAVERGLAEVRDALHSLTPAENLVVFHDAVYNLSQKIDALPASGDPAAFQQLEAAISTLRGILTHVASNEALAQLAGEVRGIAAKIDEATAAADNTGTAAVEALEILEKRITHIADALDSRMQNGGSVPPQLEAVIKGLSEKMERVQLSSGDMTALSHVEDRIVKLVEKLDASGARFSQLEAIERGLADLLIHLESGAATRGAGAAVDVQGLQRDIARTQNSLESVHGTLGVVVDRLATLESGLRTAPPVVPAMPQAAPMAAPSTAPTRLPPAVSVAPPPPSRATAAAQAAAAMARANPQAHKPIDPNLPPDHPLEPGLRQRRSPSSPSERIAASEADLGPARPPVIADPGGKSNFIAAARRAAQAAATEPTAGDLRAGNDEHAESDETIGKKIAQRVRSIFVGASVILIVGGALKLAANWTDAIDPVPSPTSSASLPQTSSKSLPLIKKDADNATMQIGPPVAPKAPAANPSDFADVTGSVTPQRVPEIPRSIAPSDAPTRPPGGDKLPLSIGGPTLRAAAAAGSPAAEYEIGARYAEGRGIAANPQEAARWLEFAAKQGLVPAQFRLGSLYEKGTGVKKDLEMARRLYAAAAEKGSAKAMHNLAVLYAEGALAKPDYKTAAQWFRKAADYGVSDSQYNLAILYARGIGMEQNLPESYKWFALAAAQGDQDAAKKRDEVAKRLDAQALSATQAIVKNWKAQPQPEEATIVPVPPAGWDEPSAQSKPKARAGGPVRIGGI
jgi:localization factor PodJL